MVEVATVAMAAVQSGTAGYIIYIEDWKNQDATGGKRDTYTRPSSFAEKRLNKRRCTMQHGMVHLLRKEHRRW